MDVEFTNHTIEPYVAEQVRAGKYPSVAAFIEAAVERVMSEDSGEPSEEDWAAIAEGDAEFAGGEYVDFDTFAAEMRKKYNVR